MSFSRVMPRSLMLLGLILVLWSPFAHAEVVVDAAAIRAVVQEAKGPGAPYGKVDSELLRTLRSSQAHGGVASSRAAQTEGVVAVLVLKAAPTPAFMARLQEAGVTVQTWHGARIQVVLTPAQLLDLSQWKEVSYIQRPQQAISHAVMAEGVAASGADVLQSMGLTGQGVRIGIIDGGFYGYEALLGSELPQSVTTMNFRTDGCGVSSCSENIHGTAVAEVIHDMAPDAQLYLVSANTDIEFENGLEWLGRQGISVVNGSIGFPYCGPVNGAGWCSKAAGALRDVGVLPVFSMGNMGATHWAGLNTDNDLDGLVEFGSSGESLFFSPMEAADVQVMVNWDDWGADPEHARPTQDIDLVVTSRDPSTGTEQVVATSVNPQTGVLGQEPTEGAVFYAQADRLYYIYLVNSSVTGTVMTHVYVNGDEVFDISPSVSQGSLMPPADSPKVMGVGAANVDGAVYAYSSWGPTWDGRVKPDITGYGCVATLTYGVFCGTSASAPSVAGAAALVKQAHPDWGPDQIEAALEMLAQDIYQQGQDLASGVGLLKVADISQTLATDLSQPGFWWDPSRDGSGLSFERHGASDFLAWYTYFSSPNSGTPLWLTSSGQAYSSMLGPESLDAWTGWPLGGPPGGFQSQATAELSLLFLGNDQGILRAMDPSTNRVITTWNLERFSYGSSALPDVRDGWWWDPAQAGNGIFVEFQGETLFAAWYNYRPDGTGRWWTLALDGFSGSGPATIPITEWSGGACITCPQVAPVARQVGEATLTFLDDENAVLTWQAEGASGTYNLQRFRF